METGTDGGQAGRLPRAVIVLAASAGGVDALSRLVAQLPAALPAAVLVVLHIPPAGPSVLPEILTRAGRLPARHAGDGELLAEGVVLVAPPDRHLAVAGAQAWLLAAARENGHRPSADVLLRSAAEAFGPRCAAAVLSGTMDDGAAGLRAVHAAGGLTLVQDPDTAAFQGMPRAAIAAGPPDYVGSLTGVARRLAGWLDGLPAPAPVAETAAAEGLVPGGGPPGGPGTELTALTCPECGGTLWRTDTHGSEQFRCRVGHAYTGDGVLAGKNAALEAALWAAIVALDERAEVAGRLARRLRGTRQQARYTGEVTASRTQAAVLRELVRGVIGDAAARIDNEVNDVGTAS